MNSFLSNSIATFKQYQLIGEKALNQIEDASFFIKHNEASNSVSNIIMHLHGNMLSRWTDFLNSDGEKEWRNRDQEFEDQNLNKNQIMQKWLEGWECLYSAMESLTEDDLLKTIYIRHQPQKVLEAIQRQIAHYAYHIGQLVYISKMYSKNDWNSMSIPKGKSNEYNQSLK